MATVTIMDTLMTTITWSRIRHSSTLAPLTRTPSSTRTTFRTKKSLICRPKNQKPVVNQIHPSKFNYNFTMRKSKLLCVIQC